MSKKRKARPESPVLDPCQPICQELYALLTRKRAYYGCEENPLENALGVAEEGIEPWVYQLSRIGEKCRRLRGMRKSPAGTLAIRETLLDIAGHALVGIALNDHLSGEDSHERRRVAVAAAQSVRAAQDR